MVLVVLIDRLTANRYRCGGQLDDFLRQEDKREIRMRKGVAQVEDGGVTSSDDDAAEDDEDIDMFADPGLFSLAPAQWVISSRDDQASL